MTKLITSTVIALLLSGCFSVSKLQYAFGDYPNDVFKTLPKQPNIHYEADGEDFANEINSYYPDAKQQIELTHGAAYIEEPQIYVCLSKKCYDKYAIYSFTSGETKRYSIILNGKRLMDENTTVAILTHEMSHAYWYQRSIGCEPRWWEEGLAVYSSGGGGAEKSTPSEAIELIKKDVVFKPISQSSCNIFGEDLAKKYNVSWPAYYRQAGMFVEYLNKSNPQAFNKTLDNLRAKQNIYDAVQNAYGVSVYELWSKWVVSVKTNS